MRSAFIRMNQAYVLAAATLFAAAGAAAPTPAGQQQHQHPAQQQQLGHQQQFHYDTGAETTIRGTVQNVTQQREERLGRGTHITLRGDDGRVHNIYIGPQEFLQRQQIQFRPGDQLELTASPAMIEGRQVLLARELTKDGRTIALRTPAGAPQWFDPMAADRVAPGPIYDRGAETTIRGTIQTVTQQKEERRGKGTHITLRGDDGRMHNVYLGPQDFLQQRQLQLRRGEQMELTGSPAMIDNRVVLLAREVTKDGRTVSLRTMEGMPQWETADRFDPHAADRLTADPMYGPAVDTTVRGEVEAVMIRKRPGVEDIQEAAVRTDDGQLVIVQLGPRDDIRRQAVRIRQGDRLEVTGTRARVGTDDILVARDFRTGVQPLEMRAGVVQPAWEAERADREATLYPRVQDSAMAERMETGVRYDRQREATIQGIIQDVRVHDRPDTPDSTHVAIRTDDGRMVTVLMGPAQHLQQHGIQLRQGAQVQVTGSRMEFEGRDTIIARQVQSEGRTVTVRDQAGQPQWDADRADREATRYPQVQDRGMAERMETEVRYDRQREATIQGTVQDIRVHDRPDTPASTHVTIRTDDGRTVTALMGPAQHLEHHGIQLRQGARVQLTGSRTEFEGRDTIIARQVQSEGRTVTVRDQAGQPQWQREQMERQHQMHQQQR